MTYSVSRTSFHVVLYFMMQDLGAHFFRNMVNELHARSSPKER